MISEEIIKKINKNQIYISTNEDLSEFGYNKHGKNRSGTIRWRSKRSEREYYQEHAEERKSHGKAYYEENREEMLQSCREWYRNNIEKQKECCKKYYEENKQTILEHNKKYSKTPEGRIAISRCSTKRNRELGFEPLNEWFPDSEGHHIDKERIIYIPKELHQSISHNVFTGKGMEEINKLAFEFLEKGMVKTNVLKSTGKPRNLIHWKKEQQEHVA